MKVLMTYDYGEDAQNAIQALGYDMLYLKESELGNEIRDFSDIEVLVCYDPFKVMRLDEMPSLKYILLSSIGIDQLPKEQVLNRSLVVTNNRGGYSKPMGEWIVWNLLSAYKNADWFYEQSSRKAWKLTTEVYELVGRTIGFLGTGTIASEACKRLSGFEVTRLGLNTQGTIHPDFDEVMCAADKLQFAARCDAVVVSMPHTSETTHFVDKAFLEAMKADAIVINISRGSVIDERALLQALNHEKFRSVHLDVVEDEPLDPAHPFWDIKRVHITPHNSWISERRNSRRFEIIYENLKRIASGEPPLNIVDVRRGY
jgi:phosphoglycerate dehydrogenase-like enzyme